MAPPNCPKCGASDPYIIKRTGRVRFECRCKGCKRHYSPLSVSNFASSKLSDEKRNAMQRFITETPNITSHHLAAVAGVSYKTAWVFKRRITEGRDAVRGYWQGRGRVRA